MENFKYKTLLLATSGILALTSLARAADDDFEKQLQAALRLSEQTAREEEDKRRSGEDELRRTLELSQKIAQEEAAQNALKCSFQNAQLSEGVKYILANPGEIRGKINQLVEKVENIIDPYMLGWNQIAQLPNPENPFRVDEVKGNAWGRFEVHCSNQNINPVVVEPLFAYLWDRHIKENPFLKAFMATYSDIFTKMKASEAEINAMLEPISQNGTPSEGQIAEVSTLMTRLGIQHSYEALQGQRDTVMTNLLQALEDIRKTPECFIEQAQQEGVHLNLLNLLVEEERAPEISQGEKEKEEDICLPSRPALDVSILDFQQRLNEEFIKRETKGGQETVMEFGETVAKLYYEDIEHHLNALWGQLFPGKAALPNPSIEEILALHQKVKGHLGHEDADFRAIEGGLRNSHKRYLSGAHAGYLTNGKTQYDYLLMVSAQVLRFEELIGLENKELTGLLLTSFFNSLVDQKNACQAGMVGRMFQIHKQILDHLIEYYKSPIKKG